jgi:hypothetical protein
VFNVQSSRLIKVVAQLGAVKINVTAVAVLWEKERQGETQFNTKTYSFLSFIPPFYANVLLLQVFFESHPVYDYNQGYGTVFFLLYGDLY